MDPVKFCKICLITDVKMHDMKDSSLADTYRKLLHHVPIDEVRQYVCYECAALLQKYEKLRTKCRTAHVLLTSLRCISDGDYDIKLKSYLNKLDRKRYKLESELTFSSVTTSEEHLSMKESKDNDKDEEFFVDDLKFELDRDAPLSEEGDIKVNNNKIKNENIFPRNNNTLNESSDFHENGADNLKNESISKKLSLNKNVYNNLKRKRNKKLPTKAKKINEKQKNTVTSPNKDVKYEDNESVGTTSSDDEPLAKKLLRIKENVFTNVAEKTFNTTSKAKDMKENVKMNGSPFVESWYNDYATVDYLTPKEAMKRRNIDNLIDEFSMNENRQKTKIEGDIETYVVCKMCGKDFKHRKNYNLHVTSQHPRSGTARQLLARGIVRKPYVCEVCGEAFKIPCFLLYHQRKHTGERPYKCNQCGKTFAYPAALSTHKSHHAAAARGARYQCDMCQKEYPSRSSITKHIKAHLGIRPYKCSICDKAFPNRYDVKVHMKYVHLKVPWPKRDRTKRRTCAKRSVIAVINQENNGK